MLGGEIGFLNSFGDGFFSGVRDRRGRVRRRREMVVVKGGGEVVLTGVGLDTAGVIAGIPWAPDAVVMLSVSAVAGAFLGVLIRLSSKMTLNKSISRKLVHLTCGPVFLLSSTAFSTSSVARYFAAGVPLFFIFRIALASMKSADPLATTISRSGSRDEVLKGPLIYVIVLLILTLFFWRTPEFVVAVTQMSFGDGFAELIGRKYGENSGKWFFNERKSYAGSVGFAITAFMGSSALYAVYSSLVQLPPHSIPFPECLPQLALISVVCALVEVCKIRRA
mmetsp:Transcript_13532/g.54251  ORF Transcript_13532/g.54251 Transcript_13532/m.54251 type:complete len:279 (-) Transcript_13532:154-990(-)